MLATLQLAACFEPFEFAGRGCPQQIVVTTLEA